MKNRSKFKILLSIMLMLALMAGMVPAAWAASSFKAVVVSGSMKVYSAKSPYKYMGSLPKGTEVTVKDYKSGVALISYNGKTGMAKAGDLEKVTSSSSAADNSASNTQKYDSKPMVANRSTRVYSKPSTSSKSVSVKAGTSLNLLAVNGNIAMVEKGGAVGYMVKSHLSEPGSVVTPAPTAKVETISKTAAVTNRATRIYQKASASSKSIAVGKGYSLNVVAMSGNIARVEKGGVYGYVIKSHLSVKTADAPVQSAAPVVTPTPTPVPTPTPAPTANTSKLENSINNSSTSSLFNSNYSSEEIVVRFLVKELGYTVAAACGVAGNIKYESGFRPTASGDSGTSYGICQWHAGRKTRLITWCGDNGYDYKTLEGQLYYLKYELTKYYTKVHKYLKACENSAQGAYDAGYYFCYHFEAPANRASKSQTRGNYAKNTVWARYA